MRDAAFPERRSLCASNRSKTPLSKSQLRFGLSKARLTLHWPRWRSYRRGSCAQMRLPAPASSLRTKRSSSSRLPLADWSERAAPWEAAIRRSSKQRAGFRVCAPRRSATAPSAHRRLASATCASSHEKGLTGPCPEAWSGQLPMTPHLYWTILALTCLYAWIGGGSDERSVAVVCLVASVVTAFVLSPWG